jgi:hypothetical protein
MTSETPLFMTILRLRLCAPACSACQRSIPHLLEEQLAAVRAKAIKRLELVAGTALEARRSYCRADQKHWLTLHNSPVGSKRGQNTWENARAAGRHQPL